MEPNSETAGPAGAVRLSRRRTLRSFAGLGVAAAAGYGSWRWLLSRPEEDGVPWPGRRGVMPVPRETARSADGRSDSPGVHDQREVSS